MKTKNLIHLLFGVSLATASALGLAGCCSTGPQAPYMDNSTLTTKVNNALENTPNLNATRISATANQGVVELRGSVDSAAQAQLAQQTAQGVYGVQRVDNRLIIGY